MMIISTAHLNQSRFKVLAEHEARNISDEVERKKEIIRLRDKYFQEAMTNPIMQRDYYPFRIRRLNPGEIDVIPFIFIISDWSDLSREKWHTFFENYLDEHRGKVYFKSDENVYFGFPNISYEDSLHIMAVLGSKIYNQDGKVGILYIVTIAVYLFEDIVRRPEGHWPEDQKTCFVRHTGQMHFGEYLSEKYPNLHKIFMSED